MIRIPQKMTLILGTAFYKIFNKQSSNTISVANKKSLTRNGLGISHLREYKFKHSFQDSLNHVCIYGKDIDVSPHCLFDCPKYLQQRGRSS